jgi:hypothetical protein
LLHDRDVWLLGTALRVGIMEQLGMSPWSVRECCQCGDVVRRIADPSDWRLRPYGCQVRAWCPLCGFAYGRARGLGVLSLFEALLEPGRLLERSPTVKSWGVVLTLPEALSWHLDGLAALEDEAELRLALRYLTSAVRGTVEGFFGSGTGAKFIFHAFHSPSAKVPHNHARGPHWHIHVLVPNVRFDGAAWTSIRERGKWNLEQLDALRRLWARSVAALPFVKAAHLEVPPALTVDVRFQTGSGGRYGLAHRTRYDYRHPVEDVMRDVQLHGTMAEGEAGAWHLERMARLQSVQLVRGVGILANVKLTQIGIERVEMWPEWEKVPGLWWDLERFDDGGAFVRMRDNGGDPVTQHWEWGAAGLLPWVPGWRYVWSGASPPPGGLACDLVTVDRSVGPAPP